MGLEMKETIEVEVKCVNGHSQIIKYVDIPRQQVELFCKMFETKNTGKVCDICKGDLTASIRG